MILEAERVLDIAVKFRKKKKRERKADLRLRLPTIQMDPLSGSMEAIVAGVADALGNNGVKNVATSIVTITTAVSFIQLDDKASPQI